MRIAIVDYGMGNLRSVQNGFRAVGVDAQVSSGPEDVRRADAVVLPGVGAFRDCMENLTAAGLTEAVTEAIRAGKPFLGICLGLQVLFEASREFGHARGLGHFGGEVVPFPEGMANGSGGRLKIPHMGWNQVCLEGSGEIPLLKGVAEGAWFYFVHSYFVSPSDEGVTATRTEYGVSFVSSVYRDSVFACQFHPERSGPLGLRVLKNFVEWARRS
ncbi:MAG: imidazole glycerol phosphate synthase subunit HisH [Nitrospinota bacterium]